MFLQPDADAGTAVSLAAFAMGLRDQWQQGGIGRLYSRRAHA